MPSTPHIDADNVLLAALREKTPSERLNTAHGMWVHAQKLIQRTLQTEHPEWTTEQINQEVARRLSHGAV